MSSQNPESNSNDLQIDLENANNVSKLQETHYTPNNEYTTTDKGEFQRFKLETPEIQQSDSLFLYLNAFTADLLAFAAGIGFSWTSPIIPKLTGTENPFDSEIDTTQISIIAAILCVGAAIGPLLFGYLSDKIGRKKSLIYCALLMIIAFVILAFSSHVKMYYLARLLHGISSGGVFTVLTMYIAEISQDHNRGKFSCILSIFITLGILYPLLIGPNSTIKNFCLSCTFPLLIFLIVFVLYFSDSPLYLVKIGNNKHALKVLNKLRGEGQSARTELAQLQESLSNQAQEKSGISEIFRTQKTSRAFMVSAGLMIIQQASGINAIMSFMEDIFEATGSSISPPIASDLIGIIQILAVFLTASLVEKLGRKFLLLISAMGSAVSILLIGLYFYLSQQQNPVVGSIWWLPILCMIIYIISYNLGIGPLPWTVLSEVFPSNIKSSASALVSTTCFLASFIITLSFPIINKILGRAQSFWMFGICCVLGVVFIYVVVPETKGKTLEEIQEEFCKK